MYAIKQYPAWMQSPPQQDSGVAPRLRVRAHGLSLTTTLILSWFYVIVIADQYGRAAYLAAEQSDFSGLGAARADFDFFLFCLPIIGFLTYWAIRLVVGCSQWLWMTASRH